MERAELSVEKFIEFLSVHNKQITKQRRTIAEIAMNMGKHFDIEELAAEVRKKDISRATVYRTVDLMVKAGVIRKAMHQNGRGAYEQTMRWHPHGHLICTNCGKVEGFTENIIEELKTSVFPKYGFEPVEYRINIRGWCSDCAEGRQHGTDSNT